MRSGPRVMVPAAWDREAHTAARPLLITPGLSSWRCRRPSSTWSSRARTASRWRRAPLPSTCPSPDPSPNHHPTTTPEPNTNLKAHQKPHPTPEQATPVVAFPPEFTTESGEVHLPTHPPVHLSTCHPPTHLTLKQSWGPGTWSGGATKSAVSPVRRYTCPSTGSGPPSPQWTRVRG